MHDVVTLLRPRLLSVKNSTLFGGRRSRWVKLTVMGAVGLLLWGGIFAVSLRVLRYFDSIETLGEIIAFKLLSMMLITLLSLLVFSSILTALSKLFLSKDLDLVHALPVESHRIFLARWTESTVDSAWMVVVYTLPVFIAYGIVFRGGPFYYVTVLSSILTLAIIASGLSVIVVMASVIVVPANRIRNIFILLGLILFLILFLAFRLLRPERMVDPETFSSVMLYLSALRTPETPYLPSTWAYDAMRAALTGNVSQGLFHMALAWSFVGLTVFSCILFADAFYHKGISKAQTSAARLFKNRTTGDLIFAFLPGPVKAFAVKEVKSFFRDQTQWSQLFLIGALVLIYVFNFKALPLEKAPINTFYLQNLLSFLNVGLAAFVLIAVTGRFAYPAVSNENEAFWLVKSGPLTIRSFMWIKFFIYMLPLLVLTEILIVATNIFLNVTAFMMALSTISIFCMVPGVIAIGIGFGAAFPNFKAENPAQTVTSFGGLLFMVVCAAFVGGVIVLEAGPVYNLFVASLHGRVLGLWEWGWVVGSFTLVLLICVLAVLLPMRFGERRLREKGI
ncbi:MAG: hypothetical protein LJE94_03555 [Deltaproteobacteria bacterium]|nr:hypothetical protein [Deltaproteobacteria bacterium]